MSRGPEFITQPCEGALTCLVEESAGGIIAAAGAIPACFGMWKGIQQETQGTLAISVAAVLLSLAVGAVLIILRVVNWLH